MKTRLGDSIDHKSAVLRDIERETRRSAGGKFDSGARARMLGLANELVEAERENKGALEAQLPPDELKTLKAKQRGERYAAAVGQLDAVPKAAPDAAAKIVKKAPPASEAPSDEVIAPRGLRIGGSAVAERPKSKILTLFTDGELHGFADLVKGIGIGLAESASPYLAKAYDPKAIEQMIGDSIFGHHMSVAAQSIATVSLAASAIDNVAEVIAHGRRNGIETYISGVGVARREAINGAAARIMGEGEPKKELAGQVKRPDLKKLRELWASQKAEPRFDGNPYIEVDRIMALFGGREQSGAVSARAQLRELMGTLDGAPLSYFVERVTELGPKAKSFLDDARAQTSTTWVQDEISKSMAIIADPQRLAAFREKKAQLGELGNLYITADRAVVNLERGDRQEAFEQLYAIIQHSSGAPVAHALEKLAALATQKDAPPEARQLIELAAAMHEGTWWGQAAVEARYQGGVYQVPGAWLHWEKIERPLTTETVPYPLPPKDQVASLSPSIARIVYRGTPVEDDKKSDK